jgi:hypothetical protein
VAGVDLARVGHPLDVLVAALVVAGDVPVAHVGWRRPKDDGFVVGCLLRASGLGDRMGWLGDDDGQDICVRLSLTLMNWFSVFTAMGTGAR